MLKKSFNGLCSFLLALTLFLPMLTNTIAHAEEANSSETTETVVSKLQLAENELTLAPGESKEIKLTYVNDKNETEDVTKSADLKVENTEEFAVFENGIINAGEDFGTSELKFTFKDATALLKVTVEEKVELESIKIDPKEFKLAVGKTLPLKVYGYYSDGTKQILKEKLTWQSSNSSVATVKDGIVTAVKEAKSNVIITVSYEDFSAKSEGKIFVQTPAKIKKITANPSKLKLKQGSEKEIKIFAYYTDGSKKEITEEVKWKVVNSKIVTVSDGTIVAKAKGATSIKASYEKFSTNITVVVEKTSKHDNDKKQDKNDDDDNEDVDHNKGKRK